MPPDSWVPDTFALTTTGGSLRLDVEVPANQAVVLDARAARAVALSGGASPA
ncbi:MAG: hypothetical protein ABWY11_20520 [Umezawaea sp.]